MKYELTGMKSTSDVEQTMINVESSDVLLFLRLKKIHLTISH